MEEGFRGCPDCGHPLVPYRTDRQWASRREVVLHWLICPNCRHVLLSHWAWLDPVGTGADAERTRSLRS